MSGFMKRLGWAVLFTILMELIFLLGYHYGYADASTSRPAQVIPAASASRSESDPGRTGAPNETARVLPSSVGAPPSPTTAYNPDRGEILSRYREQQEVGQAGASGLLHVDTPAAPSYPLPSPAPSEVRDLDATEPSASVVSVRGTASWYSDSRKDGLYAAAGPALRTGDWRGSTVEVCAARCVRVVLSDFCRCVVGSSERIIDLSSEAFSALAPLSAGLVRVTVTP